MKRDSGNTVDTEVVYKKFRTPEDFRATLMRLASWPPGYHVPIVDVGQDFIVLRKGRDLTSGPYVSRMLDLYEGLWLNRAKTMRTVAEYNGYVERRITEQGERLPPWLRLAWECFSHNIVENDCRETHGDATPENCVFIDLARACFIDVAPRPGMGSPAEDIGKLWLCATTNWGCREFVQQDLHEKLRKRKAFAITDEVRAHAIGHAIRVLHYTPTADFSGLRSIL